MVFVQEKPIGGRKMVIYRKLVRVGDLITMNFHLKKVQKNPIRELESEMRKYSDIDADSAIFCGTLDEWKTWSTVNSDGIRFSLHNGENLNGEIKIYTSDGFLESVRQYKDGLLDGEYSSYHTNGIQSRSINYSKGLKDGKKSGGQKMDSNFTLPTIH